MARQPVGPARRVGQFLAGLAALVALVALVAGVPILLVKVAGNPLPQKVPSLDRIGQMLIARDNGQLFLHALVVVAWLAWATFALSVMVEIPAAVRRRPTLRLPGMGLQQRLAATLVASVGLIFLSPAVASAANAHPVPAAAVATVSAVPGGHTLNHLTWPVQTAPAASTGASQLVYEVARGDQLSDIAARFLADANRYPEIAQLNGLPDADHIEGGQQLRLPPGAVDSGARVHATSKVHGQPAAGGHAATATELVYQVARGDRLFDVAARFLGDANRYPEIAELNGLSDADHIEGGQQLRLPPGAVDAGPRVHATGELDGRPVPPAPDLAPRPPAAQTPAPPAPAPVTPPSTPSPTTSASHSASPSAGASASPTPASSADAAAMASPNGHQPVEDDSMFNQALVIGVPLIGAGLLAALLLTTLRRHRRRQEQHRPVGRRMPDPIKRTVERDLRVVAQPIAVDRLDQALRVLAAALVDRPSDQMPDIVGVWLDGDTIHLLLTGPCPNAPAPWVGDHLNWTLPADTPLPDVDGQLAPLPTLVTVGSQPGMHLMLDLERLGLLTLTGDANRVADLLRYLAVELACNAWSDHVDVTVAGFDATETGQLIALAGDRIDAVPSIAVAIERIRRRAGQVIQSLDHLAAGDPLTGRIADIAADAWMPHVLLAKDPGPDELAALENLDNDLAATGRCAVAVAVTSNSAVGRWPLSIDDAGRLTIAFLGMTDADATLTAAGLPRIELGNLAELLTAARSGDPASRSQPDDEEPETWPAVPPALETESWAAGTDAAGGLLDDPIADRPTVDESGRDADIKEHDPTDDEAPDLVALGQSQEIRLLVDTPAGDAEPAAHHPPARDEAARIPAVVPLSARQPTRRKVTTPVRRHSDPTLDADVRAWNEADPTRPRISILGPVTVEAPGQVPSERLRFYAEIIVYLAVKGVRGALTDQFDEALWPEQQVKATSRRVAVARARRWLGETPDGEQWLPDATADRRYRLRDGYLLDWHLFRRLRSRGESRGPAGISDLRQALALVRGAPLAGADIAYSSAARNPYTWLPMSEIQPHHLAAAVVDTAHRLVELCLGGGDIVGARWAVEQAWLADSDQASDIAWRDLLRVAAAEGNAAELDQLLGELMRVRDAEVPEDLDRETYRLLCDLMPERMRAGVP